MKFRVWLESEKWPYLGQCDRVRGDCASEENWHRMMDLREPVPLEELEDMVDTATILDPDDTMEEFGKGDPESGAYKSMWGDKPCYLFQTSGFEFIWVSP